MTLFGFVYILFSVDMYNVGLARAWEVWQHFNSNTRGGVGELGITPPSDADPTKQRPRCKVLNTDT